MTITTEDFALTRETVREMLDSLGLVAYLYELEPRDDHWELRVECALNGGWETVMLSVPESDLRCCRYDVAARERMLEAWRPRLEACRKRGEP